MLTIPKTFSLAVIAVIANPSRLAAGSEYPVSPATVPPPLWAPSVRAGYLHQFESDLDSGGSFSVDRALLRAGVTRAFDRKHRVGLSLGYGFNDYHFDGPAMDPWSDVHTLGLSMQVFWGLDESWDLFAIPTLRSAGEGGADFSDSLNGGALAGVSYRFGDHLSLGPGIGVLSQIEDDPSVYPMLLIQWEITDGLTLETGRGFGASQGPGLTLNWQATDRWAFSIGSRYEKLRFRLDDTGTAPDGVGEDKGVPVTIGATFATSRFSGLSIYAGARFGGSVALEDRSGREISSSDQDVAPFAGIIWNLGF